MTNSKTILLWGNDDLLSSYIQDLLTGQKGWKVICIPIEDEVDMVLQVVHREQPHSVIIQSGDRSSIPFIPTLLLQINPNLVVMTLNLNNNLMEVYSKQDILIRSSSDLISVIEANQ